MSNSSGGISAFATAKFAKFQNQPRQGKVISEYDAAKKAEYAKTARLRALRLAKEEEDRRIAAELSANDAAAESKPTARRRAGKSKPSASAG